MTSFLTPLLLISLPFDLPTITTPCAPHPFITAEQWADGSAINLVVMMLTISYISVIAIQRTLKEGMRRSHPRNAT